MTEEEIEKRRRLVLGVALQALCRRAAGDPVCIKMRSGSALVFREITEAYPGAESVFLFRQVEPWARSWIGAFGADFRLMTKVLLGCIRAAETAREQGLEHRVVWYEELVRQPAAACRTVLGAAAVAGRIDEARLRRALDADSQQGTELASGELQRRRAAGQDEIDRATESFLRSWRQVQPTGLINALGLLALAV